MNTPKLAVIIPVYNLGKYLDECLNSFDTSNPDIEVLMIDDGSTDELTIERLKHYDNQGFQVYRQTNQGVAAARNALMEKTSAPFVLPVDPDNLISDEYIRQGINILEKRPEVGVVYSDVKHFSEDQETDIQLKDMIPGKFLVLNYIDNCAIYRRDIWETAGGYDPNMPKTGYEDWEMWITALEQGWEFHHIRKVLFQYRLREDSMVQTTREVEHHSANFDYLLKKHTAVYAKYEHEVMHHIGVLIGEFVESREQNILNHKRETEKVLNALEDSNVHLTNTRNENAQLVKQLNHSMNSVLKLQQRVNELESTLVYRFNRKFNILLNRFRSNSDMGKSKNFFRKVVIAFSRKSRQALRKVMAKVFKHLYLYLEEARVVIVESGRSSFGFSADPYMNWFEKNRPTENELQAQRIKCDSMKNAPFFSIIVPVYNPPIQYFKMAIDSALQQSYENLELILSDDCSTDPEVKRTIEYYRKRDPRVKPVYREVNGHISAASNSGLEIAEGNYIVLFDHDDLLPLNALYEVAKVIDENPDIDLVYSDEDKIDETGMHSMPHFKPDWSPESILSRNYLDHLVVFRSSIMKEIGGWRVGYEGSQDHDLILRFTEKTNKVYHIPKILYHWRIHKGSVASAEEAKPYAYIAAQKALTEALQRRDTPGTVDFLSGFMGYSIRLEIKDPNKLVSIIIPTKDKADILEVCLESIFNKTSYPNFEVIVVDNNSGESDTFQLFDRWQKIEPERFKCVRTEEPFNFAYLMNFGRQSATGEYLVLLNNDTEVISEDWLEGMVEQAQRKSIGVAGVKLLYPNDTIQHAGVVIGLGAAAGHVLVGEHRDGPGYFNYVNLLNNYSALTAACFMVRTEVFDEVNGFDEDFAVEYNDVDFCLRVREAGYRNLYIPHVELYHYESISRGHPHLTKESTARHQHEVKLLRTRWSKYLEHDPHYNPNLSLRAQDFRMRE